MYDFYKHRDHLVRFDGKIWKDVTQTNKPKFTHQQLASRFDIWTEAQKDNGDFEFIRVLIMLTKTTLKTPLN